MIQLNSHLPKVLIIEDDPLDLELITSAIEENGGPAAFQSFRDGTEAIFLLRQIAAGPTENLPDLIILDLSLPIVPGQDVLAFIKQQQVFRGIPTVVLTTASSPAVQSECAELEADVYIVKPSRYLDWQDKLRQLEPLLRKKPTPRV